MLTHVTPQSTAMRTENSADRETDRQADTTAFLAAYFPNIRFIHCTTLIFSSQSPTYIPREEVEPRKSLLSNIIKQSCLGVAKCINNINGHSKDPARTVILDPCSTLYLINSARVVRSYNYLEASIKSRLGLVVSAESLDTSS